MRVPFALLLVIIGVAQISAVGSKRFKHIKARACAGKLSEKYPQTDEDVKASQKAVQHAEYFRRFMHTGIGHLHPVDPYKQMKIRPIVFNGSNSELFGTLYLDDVVARGAADFHLKTMDVYLKTRRVDFNFEVPKIVITAQFSAVNFHFYQMVFNTSGTVIVKMVDYSVVGGLSIEPLKSGDHYMVSGLEVNTKVNSGVYSTSTPIGMPSDAAKNDMAEAVTQAVAESVVKQMSNLLLAYTMEQVDTIMMPKSS